MILTCIYARAENGVIGRDGTLPWHLPADLKHFKALTMGKPMIMGRKTFDSLPGLLPGREHIVLTRDKGWTAPGAHVVHSVKDALAAAGDDASVIGGAAVFRLFLPHATRVELTEIHRAYDGDVVMPELGPQWQTVAREDFAAEGDTPAYSFITLERAE